jgi:hypothetical protein
MLPCIFQNVYTAQKANAALYMLQTAYTAQEANVALYMLQTVYTEHTL